MSESLPSYTQGLVAAEALCQPKESRVESTHNAYNTKGLSLDDLTQSEFLQNINAVLLISGFCERHTGYWFSDWNNGRPYDGHWFLQDNDRRGTLCGDRHHNRDGLRKYASSRKYYVGCSEWIYIWATKRLSKGMRLPELPKPKTQLALTKMSSACFFSPLVDLSICKHGSG